MHFRFDRRHFAFEFAAELMQQRLVNEHTVGLHAREHADERLFDVSINGAQRAGGCDLRPQRLVQLAA